MTTLEEMRSEIERIDRRIVSLLDRRMAACSAIGELKAAAGEGVEDREREEALLEILLDSGTTHLTRREIEEIYASVFRCSRMRQSCGPRSGPRLCVTVLETDLQTLLLKGEKASSEGHVVEFRLDALERIELDSMLPWRFGPCVVTNRKADEGGFFKGGERERLEYLEATLDYEPSYIDLEWRSPHALRSRILGAAGNTRTILSFHETRYTPPLKDLLTLWEEMAESGADVVKVVTLAKRFEDCLTILRFLVETGRQGPKVIGHCMGEFGKPSRVLAPLFGSFLAYAAPEGGIKGAEGQLSAGEMMRAWDVLGL